MRGGAAKGTPAWKKKRDPLKKKANCGVQNREQKGDPQHLPGAKPKPLLAAGRGNVLRPTNLSWQQDEKPRQENRMRN